MAVAATAQRVGDAPARRVTDVAPGAVVDVSFRVPVTNGLALHLAADAIPGLDDGDPVSQWDDLSGSGNHARQTTAANQPLYRTGQLNGAPVVRFDGVNDWLNAGTTIQPNRLTMIAVFQITAFANDFARIISKRKGTGLEGYYLSFGGGADRNRMRSLVNTGVWIIYNGAHLVTDRVYLVVGMYDGAAVSQYFDGVLDGSTAGTGNIVYSADSPTGIGGNAGDGGSYLRGDIAELLIYGRALSDAERQAVESYLADKYDLTLP